MSRHINSSEEIKNLKTELLHRLTQKLNGDEKLAHEVIGIVIDTALEIHQKWEDNLEQSRKRREMATAQ
jgi:hypothetical protein